MDSQSPSSDAVKEAPARVLAALPIKEFAIRQLAGRLDRVETEWNRCAESSGADEIHDLRVALRRFGETLWLFRRLFPKRERKQVRAELKTALRFAGDTRDVDIAFESFDAAGVTLSPEVRLHLESERAIAEAALVATLAVGRRTRVIERWRRALVLQPNTPFVAPPPDERPPAERPQDLDRSTESFMGGGPLAPNDEGTRRARNSSGRPSRSPNRARRKRATRGIIDVRSDSSAVFQPASVNSASESLAFETVPPELEATSPSPDLSEAELLRSDLSEAEVLGLNEDELVPVAAATDEGGQP
jgi:CHAD domain-containing protein